MKATHDICAIDMMEYYISRAEIFNRNGKIKEALQEAQKALPLCVHYTKEKEISLRIFIAKCLSNLGQIEESNKEYRSLIDEDIYLPPIILGLLHNSLLIGNDQKIKTNVSLMKLFIGSNGGAE